MSDADLTSLELRVLSCICWHDRLSETTGGRGCFAANRVMAEEVACTASSLSRAITKLVERGYVERDRQGVPGRMHQTVYRVRYDHLTVVQRDNEYLSNGTIDPVASVVRNAPKHLSETAETVVRPTGKNGGNLRLVHPQEKEEKIRDPLKRDLYDFERKEPVEKIPTEREVEDRLAYMDKVKLEGPADKVALFREISSYWGKYPALDERVDLVGSRILDAMSEQEIAAYYRDTGKA